MVETKCKKCGCEIEQGKEYCSKCSNSNNIFKNKKFWIIIGVIFVVAILIVTLIIYNDKVQKEKEAIEQEKYNNLPIKVDISMTSYYGTIEYILYELGLDFDLVTMGANCYTGVQRNEFNTERYGILYTEFRYCKSNNTTIFRVYNNSKDQELRDPKPGELAEFDEFGEKIIADSDNL